MTNTRTKRLLAAAALFVLAACVNVPSQTPSMKQAGIEDVTATQLREIVLQFATDYAQAVELFADSLRNATENPHWQYRALLWKATMLTNIRQAALISDPMLALLDVWLYTRQLRDFIESPPPQYEYSELRRAAALALFEEWERRGRDVVVRLVGPEKVAEAEPKLIEFAAANPIDPLTLNRTSIMAIDSLALRDVGGGIGGAIGATYWSMRDVADRASAINAALGKELRWNLQLMAYELAQMPLVDSTLTSLRTSLDRIAALADTLPPLVSGEREAVLDALHAELVGLTRAINGMRMETLDAVTAERLAVLTSITEHRIAVLTALSQERIATVAAMDTVLTRAIDHSNSLVDHIFWRAFQLMAVLGVGLVLLVLLLLRVLRGGQGPSV
jgi:hypothetical protein